MGARKSFQEYCVSVEGILLDALKVIDRDAEGFAVVLDENGAVYGTLTDGDIRRALLSGNSLQSPLKPYACADFNFVAPEESRAQVLDLMQARRLRQIPILDGSRNLVGIHFFSHLLGHIDRPNWAVIMAGGKGTRLGKLTSDTPKPMLKVAGKPILERLVLHLISYGIKRIFLSVNHLSHVIEDYFADGSKWGCSIGYLREEKPLRSGGALSLLPEKPQDPLVLMNGDLLIDADIAQMLAFHESQDFFAPMGVYYYSHEIPFGCIETREGEMLGIEEKPVLVKTINGGVYVLSPDAVSTVPESMFFPITQLFEDALQHDQRCGAYHLDGDWIDIGVPEQLKKARGQA